MRSHPCEACKQGLAAFPSACHGKSRASREVSDLLAGIAAGQRQGEVVFVDVFETVLDVIDLRSFSNLWYWIALAVLWSSTSHWVIGVPYDMIIRGRRQGGQAQQDLEDITRINVNRLLSVVRTGAVAIVGFACFWLSVLGVLAFYYNVEFAQAVFFLVAPMTLVIWLTLRACHQIEAGEGTGAALHRRLTIHRRLVQGVGMTSITVTAFYGMWQNLSNSVLG